MRRALLVLLSSLILGGCSVLPKKSGIEIMSYPPAKVLINGKESGMTPYKNTTLKPGDIEIGLETNDYKWSKKVRLNNNINTVIDWELGKEEKQSGGYVLYMERTGNSKNSGILVNVNPDKAAVAIDGEIKGFSPLRIDSVTEGDRQITLSYPGFKTVNVFVKAVPGYQLIVEAKLIEEGVENLPTPTITPTVGEKITMVVIKETETGWLRVRQQANSESGEIARVNPKDKYPLMEENQGWYKIDLGGGKEGWISAKYADKL